MRTILKLLFLPILTLSLSSCSFGVLPSSKSDNSSSVISSVSSSFSSSEYISFPSEDSNSLWDESQNFLRVGQKNLNFYNFNDFHGSVNYVQGEEPGIYKLSTYINSLKYYNPNGFILTSSGDMWQGSADSNITKGKLVLDWMEYIGFEAMALGNHEFDWNIDLIKENQSYKPDIPFLACNIIDKSTKKLVDWVKPYTTITKNGVHIGIIGALCKGIERDIVASTVKDITFADPTNYVIETSKYLKNNGADVILYLLHGSVNGVSKTLGNYVDLVFGGHTHAEECTTLSGTNIPMIQASYNGEVIGNINLKYNFSTNTITYGTKDLVSINYTEIEDDNNVWDIYNNQYYDQIHQVIDVVYGYTETGLTRYGELERLATRYIYNYYCDNASNKYPITLVKHNNARDDLLPGNITYGDIYRCFPFDNYIVLVKIKGKYLNSTSSYFNTYAKEYDYLVDETLTTYQNDTDYYVLTMNYISEKYETRNEYEVVEKYMEWFPRDIISSYISTDYPIR